MKKEELLVVYGYAGAIWSTFKLPEDEREARLFDVTWYEILRHYNIELILIAIKEYAKISDFCNIAKVGEICKKLQKTVEGKYIDEDVILDEIRQVVVKYSKDAGFEKLSDFAKKVVGGPWQLYKWGCLEIGQFDTVVVSDLRKKIKNMIDREKLVNVAEEIKIMAPFSKKLLEVKDE